MQRLRLWWLTTFLDSDKDQSKSIYLWWQCLCVSEPSLSLLVICSCFILIWRNNAVLFVAFWEMFFEGKKTQIKAVAGSSACCIIFLIFFKKCCMFLCDKWFNHLQCFSIFISNALQIQNIQPSYGLIHLIHLESSRR